MAYQTGILRLKGTLGDVTFYKMNGEYHARLKSSLTGKKFWKHRAFERSRRSCKRFGEGNKLASQVYRALPKEKRLYALFCQLKTAAIHYIKMGLTAEEAKPYLQQHAEQEQFVLPNRLRKPAAKRQFPYAIRITANFIALNTGRLQQLLQNSSKEQLQQRIEQILAAHCISPPAATCHLARA